MKRSGFSLVELVVVLGIIGTVLALMLPALQAGGEAARRGQCLNNLKQLHLALQSYHGTHSVFPPGVVDDVRPFSTASATRRVSWTAMLLPWSEQTAMYNVINFDAASTAPENTTARGTWINMFVCPDTAPGQSGWAWRSSETGPRPELGRSSYAACHHDVETAIDVDNHGVFFLNSRVRAADVFDGLSQTIFMSEVSEPAAEGWFVGGRSTLRNTGATINAPDVASSPEHVGGFGSRHRGDGANFAFGDGSIRFLRQTIDPVVYRRLGNRDDGEEVGDDAY